MNLKIETKFKRAIATIATPDQSERLQTLFQANYRKLLSSRQIQTNTILEKHQTSMILPTIALAQALQTTSHNEKATQDWLDSFFREYFQGTKATYQLLGKIPGFFGILRIALRQTMKTTYPEAGWKRVWHHDTPQVMAFDMQSCHYHAILKHHGYEKLLSTFCRLDDLMYQNMSAQVSWDRTTTIAQNGSYCNFRFSKSRRTAQQVQK